MRYFLSVLLLPALLPQALAQNKEAEKLFHAMEKKIKAAKAVQITVDIELRAIKGQEKNFDLKGDPGKFKGFLLFTKDNKARLKISRDFVGMEMVSNGKQMKLAYEEAGVKSIDQAKAEPTPKHLHGLLSTLVSRVGVEAPALLMPRLLKYGLGQQEIDPEALRWGVWDFKAGAAEKVGGRDAKVISYVWGSKDGKRAQRFTLWIDAKTLLPLKHVSAIESAQITETYTEFKLDPKIDAKAFDLVPARNEAEKLFRAMEKKIDAAKAVQVTFDIEMKGKGREGKYKGSLLFTKDNKARLKMTGKERGKKVTREMISDGKQLKAAEVPETFDLATEEATPTDLHRRLSTLVSRPGLRGYSFILLSDAPVRGPVDVMSLFCVADFKAGAAQKVGGRDAKVVTYKATMETQDAGRYKVTVWIDAKTLLPLKRLIVPEGLRERITEIYNFKLNPKVDAKTFELPK
jgi:outer membrane lipoprotein-sorting protein